MTTADPRTILAEMQVIHDAALSSNANRTLGKTLAALTAVLDLYKHVTYPDEGDPYLTGRADGYELAMARVHREIKHALGGDRG